MKPFWMRRHWACPDCGQVISIGVDNRAHHEKTGVDCLKCKAHFSWEDFENENVDKWGHAPSLEEEILKDEIHPLLLCCNNEMSCISDQELGTWGVADFQCQICKNIKHGIDLEFIR